MSLVIHPDRSSVATVSASVSSSTRSKREVALLLEKQEKQEQQDDEELSLVCCCSRPSSSSSSSSLWRQEVTSMWNLAIPTIIINLSFVVPPFWTASYVGRHFGYVYLDGYTLANLTGNLMTLALLQGLYNACDTLSPQAFGAGNYREVGLLAMRGFIATLLIIVPINAALFVFMKPLLVSFFGQDEEASQHAWQFYLLYALSFPFNSLYCIQWKFLSSQGVLRPLVICTLVSTCLVLPILLEFGVAYFGFLGAAAAITAFYMVESGSLLAWIFYFQPHHPDTWPGLSALWPEALAWEPFQSFFLLGMGGMLASLEWVYWEALALVIGTLGVVPLSAHTVPTQVMFVLFMFPYGVGIALAIRLGDALAQPHQVDRAKRLALGTLVFSCIFFGMTAVLLYIVRDSIIGLFLRQPENSSPPHESPDDDLQQQQQQQQQSATAAAAEVVELCDQIWVHVCIYFFVLGQFGINVGISLGLGMQWTLGVVTAVCLWLIGMPTSYYCAVVRGGGLLAAWRCIWPPYLLINAYMMAAYYAKDWESISDEIRIREGAATIVNVDSIKEDEGERQEKKKRSGGGSDYGKEVSLESLVLMESPDYVDSNNGTTTVATIYGTDNKR